MATPGMATPTPRRRLGWLGPALALIGIAAGSVGIYVMATSRPKPGPFIDVVAVGERGALVVRSEATGRSFVELYEQGAGLRWQALVPPYAGTPTAPGIEATVRLVNVRVARSGRPEVFSLALADSIKVGGLNLADAWPPSPTNYVLPSGLFTTSATRSFHVVGDASHGAVYELSRTDGTVRWRYDVGGGLRQAWPIGEEQVGVETVTGEIRVLDATTGVVVPGATAPLPAAPAPVAFDAATHALTVGARTVRWPADAFPPQRHHVASDQAIWLATPTRVALIDLQTLRSRWVSSGAPIELPPL